MLEGEFATSKTFRRERFFNPILNLVFHARLKATARSLRLDHFVLLIIVILLLLRIVFSLTRNLHKESKILVEVVLVSVLRKHLKYANEAEVAVVDHVVQQRCVGVRDHTCHSVLTQDLMLVLEDLVQIYFPAVVWVVVFAVAGVLMHVFQITLLLMRSRRHLVLRIFTRLRLWLHLVQLEEPHLLGMRLLLLNDLLFGVVGRGAGSERLGEA